MVKWLAFKIAPTDIFDNLLLLKQERTGKKLFNEIFLTFVY